METKACWYRKCKPNTAIVTGGWIAGRLVQFGQDHIEYDSGPGPIMVAVVIDEATLKTEITVASAVAFGTEPPS